MPETKSKPKKVKIMVASAVYGFEDQLSQIVAQLRFVRGYIEMLGSGTLRMIKDCKTNGFKSPVWQDKENILKVTFPGLSHNRKIEGANKGVMQKLAVLLDAINKHDRKRVPFYADITGLPPKSIERYMKQLRDAGLIDFDGDATRTGGYHIADGLRKRLEE